MGAEKPDMRAVLDHYDVAYHPDRASQKIICPIHEETRQSCSINLDEGWYNCHACNSKGDAWNLIMDKEGIDFAAALTVSEGLAKAGGGPVRKADDARTDGLLGRTRPVRRNGERRTFRPSLRSLSRS